MIRIAFISLKFLGLFFLGWVCLGVHAADARDQQKKLKIIAQAVGFVKDRDYKDVDMLVVFSPQDQQSVEDAERLLGTVGTGFSFGKVRINARKATVDEALHALPDLYLFQGGVADLGRLYTHAAQNKILTFSTYDDTCMQNDQCVLFIKTSPRVDIFLNRKAASDSGVKFDAAFRLMVKEK